MIRSKTTSLKTIKQIEKELEANKSPAGLARTKKLIFTNREREVQFIKLCSQIRLDDFREERADKQREERKSKRMIKNDYV